MITDAAARQLPPMNEKRLKHCSIIIRGFLFVFFGYIEDSTVVDNISDTLEYLDLEDPNSQFK